MVCVLPLESEGITVNEDIVGLPKPMVVERCCASPLENDENEEPLGISDAMMARGTYLRKLKEMALADELERATASEEEKIIEDKVEVLSTGQKVLRYDSFLAHQRYYDDLKHVDFDFIDYGSSSLGCVIQQEKSLGKGGLCWDAALILAEHLVSTRSISTESVIELGAGTGLCGILLAKLTKCHVEITDLPLLMPLMQRNIELNFSNSGAYISDDDIRLLHEEEPPQPLGSCEARVLDWGDREDGRKYPVIVGADVVASLYDPIKLAETIHSLCQEDSKVFISYKSRLDGPHQLFEGRMRELYETVECMIPQGSRNKNPNVKILQAFKPRFR
mmetsp:Transcript_30849/g.46810  ORF Transcript_30849/g.46810 Transcript_30849/m.46810 type:complete len:333 (-) Transcript_30849:131-1129(-)